MQPAIAAIGSNLLIANQIKDAAAALLESRLPIQVISQDELGHTAPAGIYLCPAPQAKNLQTAQPKAAVIALKKPAGFSKAEAAQFLTALAGSFGRIADALLELLPPGTIKDATDARAWQGLDDELAEAIDLLRTGAKKHRLPLGRRPARKAALPDRIAAEQQELAVIHQKLTLKTPAATETAAKKPKR